MAKRKTGRPTAGPRRRATAPRRPAAAPPPPKSGYRERVALKFRDFVDLPYVDGVESVIKKRKLGPWDRLAKDFPGITLRRLFPTVTGKRLTELQLQATRLDPTYRPPDLRTYFAIVCPPDRDPRALSAALRAWAIVEFAYVDPQDAPAAVPTGINPLYNPPLSQQVYLTAAPTGISAEQAWPLPGGSGEGQRAIDIERAFLETTRISGRRRRSGRSSASSTTTSRIPRTAPRFSAWSAWWTTLAAESVSRSMWRRSTSCRPGARRRSTAQGPSWPRSATSRFPGTTRPAA